MQLSKPIITGYYRYTDIMFEWHQVISDPAERSALKAFLSRSSLIDPKNPLRSENDKGLELYIGTLAKDGRLRLLFSLAQVEYIRDWLHAMGLTKSLLPLPSSEFLLTMSSLRNCTSIYIDDLEELKKAIRNVEKNNRRLKGADSNLVSVRQIFEKVRSFWESKAGTWLAIDFEAWEMDHSVITECGWSYIQWKDGKEVAANGHYIVDEHMIYINGKYVPNMRDRYTFGKSEVVKISEFKKILHKMIDDFCETGPLYLVFHDCSQDIKYLKSLNAPIECLSYLLPDMTPDDGIFVVDTTDLFGALQGDVSEKRSLERMCLLLKTSTTLNMHNAGNDAHYTLLALKSMASGNQLDAQREERWPNQTHADQKGTSVKVEFKPWEEDSDYSDMEGAFKGPAEDEDPMEEDNGEGSQW